MFCQLNIRYVVKQEYIPLNSLYYPSLLLLPTLSSMVNKTFWLQHSSNIYFCVPKKERHATRHSGLEWHKCE